MDTKILCLGALALGEASGYEIKKRFEEGPLAHFNRAAFGSIYPALKELEAEGKIETRIEHQDGRPNKKVHSLTQSGRLTLTRAVEEPPQPDQFRSDFLFMLFFSDFLSDEAFVTLVEERCAFFRQRIANMQECCFKDAAGESGHRMTHGYGLALYRAALDYLESILAERSPAATKSLAKTG